MGNIVAGTEHVRVKAVAKGVFTGASGSIVVCDPDGSDPLARFPRVQAQDIRQGLDQRMISLKYSSAELAKSDAKGNTKERPKLPDLVGEEHVDLSALMEYETATPLTTSFSNELAIAQVPGSGSVDIGDLEVDHDPVTGEVLDQGQPEGEGEDVPPAGGAKPASTPAKGKNTTAAKA